MIKANDQNNKNRNSVQLKNLRESTKNAIMNKPPVQNQFKITLNNTLNDSQDCLKLINKNSKTNKNNKSKENILKQKK